MIRATRNLEESPSRFTRAALPAIVLLAAIGYTLTAPRWILGGDNGEFSALYAAGGIAHPPGYPAMVLWLRAWHWLPVDTPALGAALATVVLGTWAVWAVQKACLAWGASTPATAFASAVYAFSPVAWKMSCHAEVMAMNALFAGAILALSAPEPRLRGTKLLGALGFSAGLALANQQTIVLLLPIGLLAGMRAAREAKSPAAAVGVGGAAFLAGLVPPYVYLYVVARTSDFRTKPMWIEAPSLAGVLFHFERGAYGTFSLAASSTPAEPLANLWLFATNGTRQMLGAPLVVLLACIVAVARERRRSGGPRALGSLLALGATFLLAGPVFVARFNLPIVGVANAVAERFYLLPEVVLTLMTALSLDALVPWLLRREALMAALTAQASLAAAILTVPEVLEHNRPSVELYVRNTLATAPENAILVSSGDHRWGGFLYARYALHLRTDVLNVVPDKLTQKYYRRDVQAETGVSLETPEHRAVGPKTLMARLLSTGRPVFCTDWSDPRLKDTPHESLGTVMRVLREGEALPPPEEVLAKNLDVFSRYLEEPTPPADVHGWGYSLLPDYARPWIELGRRFGEAGDVGRSQLCYAQAARWAPWLVTRE